MPVSTADFDLVSSLRYDPKLLTSQFNTELNGIELPYLLFVYHVDRLIAAATHFGWSRALQTMKEPGAPERLRHMCDQAVMDCVLTDKEKGLGVSVTFLLSLFVFFRPLCALQRLGNFSKARVAQLRSRKRIEGSDVYNRWFSFGLCDLQACSR